MKNKFIALLLIIISLFMGSCHNSTEPPPVKEKSLLTGKIAFSAITTDSSAIYTISQCIPA
jgi:hypothetical protein